MFEFLTRWMAPAEAKGSQLSDIPDPKGVKKGARTIASFITRGAQQKGEQRLQEKDRRVASTDLLTFRASATTKETIRQLSATSPDLSASNFAYARLTITRNFTAVARDQDGTINPAATLAAQQLLSRFNYLTDYTDGFSGMTSIHSLGEQLVKEFRQYGSASLELVLDKALLPSRLQPVSTTQIKFIDDGSGYVYPLQEINGQKITLDQPTFFYAALDQDLLEAYSTSPLEASLQAVLSDVEFTNDVRRVIKKALHPRLDVGISFEEFRKMVPIDIQNDPEKVRAFQEAFITSIQDKVTGLEPDDAMVHFDNVEFSYINNGNASLSNEYKVLQDAANSKMASGAKTPPAVLGHGAGSQNIASTETLLFLRYCEGIQQAVNSLISRAMTLGLRLMGHDVYCVFEFDRVDIRPEAELEAFRTMRQSRILDLLSLGFMTDEQACIALTGSLSKTPTKLSGTMFRTPGAGDPSQNPYSNTSQDANGQATKPDTPNQPKGAPAQLKKVK